MGRHNNVDVHERVKEWARTSDSTQVELAKELGVSRQRVQQILSLYPTEYSTWRTNKRERSLRKRLIAERANDQRLTRNCRICDRKFRAGNTYYFCSLCASLAHVYYRMTDPARHEKHRLLVAQRRARMHPNDPFAKATLDYYEQHGHLLPPNRRFEYSYKSNEIKTRMGDRWAEVERRFDEYYADNTRRI